MSKGSPLDVLCEHARLFILEFGSGSIAASYSHAADDNLAINVREDAVVKCLDCDVTLTGQQLKEQER